jgi:hypothetical protein
MTGLTYTQKSRPGEFIVSESIRARDNVTVTGAAAMVPGQVLGRVATPVVVAAAANTGDGDAAGMTVALGANYQPGTYVLTCTAEEANKGTFAVRAPDGSAVGNATVATEFSTGGHLTFTIPDGAEDWDIGDVITIAIGQGLLTAHDEDSTDGSQIAVGVLLDAVDPTGGDVAAVMLARDCEVSGELLTWPASGTTAAEKQTAIQALAVRGIVVR